MVTRHQQHLPEVLRCPVPKFLLWRNGIPQVERVACKYQYIAHNIKPIHLALRASLLTLGRLKAYFHLHSLNRSLDIPPIVPQLHMEITHVLNSHFLYHLSSTFYL